MQEFKGTPGEWEVMNSGDIFGPPGGDSGDGVTCDERDGWQVAEVGHYSSFVDGELVDQGDAVRKANLALLLAAKDLLETLIMVRDADNDCAKDGLPTIPAPARSRIDAAIAKALNTDTTER